MGTNKQIRMVLLQYTLRVPSKTVFPLKIMSLKSALRAKPTNFQGLVFMDHVYYWHPRLSVDRYWRSTPQSTRDRHSIDTSVDPRLAHGRHLRRQTFNFRWHTMEWRSILAMTTHWMPVDVSIATLRLAVGRMSVVCQWCIGSLSVMYSSQYPSSPVGTPLYGLYRYVRPQRV